MKAEILKMLREADGYISGQEICEKFNVSRTAVWKVIRRLQEDGYEVEAVRNKGYRMVESPDILTKEEVESCMHTEWAGRNVVCYKVTDSTNLRIKQMGGDFLCCSTFAKGDRDYEQNQKKRTLLKKERIHIPSNITTVLLNKLDNESS